nr:hypothetical protein CcurKRNrm2_p140 [Cryptomonas curvata]
MSNIAIIAIYLERDSSVFFADLKLLELFKRFTAGEPGSPFPNNIDTNLLFTSSAAELYCSSFAFNV